MTPIPGLRAILTAGAAALVLSGCVALPIGTFDDAQISSGPVHLRQDLYFQNGEPLLLPGEAARMNQALRDLALRPQDEVIVTFGSTGSETLDAQRVATLRGIIASNPARLSVIAPVTASTTAERPDVALLQVRLFKRILVTCPANGVPFDEEPLNPQIREFGCASAVNLAESAADKRDLSTPRELRGSDAIQSVRAVETYRTQKITVLSPEIDPSN